jgi:hypothetical protein
MATKSNPMPTTHGTHLRRRNLITAWVLVFFAFSVGASVFVWRYAHNQPAIPQGGSYGATYQVQQ